VTLATNLLDLAAFLGSQEGWQSCPRLLTDENSIEIAGGLEAHGPNDRFAAGGEAHQSSVLCAAFLDAHPPSAYTDAITFSMVGVCYAAIRVVGFLLEPQCEPERRSGALEKHERTIASVQARDFVWLNAQFRHGLPEEALDPVVEVKQVPRRSTNLLQHHSQTAILGKINRNNGAVILDGRRRNNPVTWLPFRIVNQLQRSLRDLLCRTSQLDGRSTNKFDRSVRASLVLPNRPLENPADTAIDLVQQASLPLKQCMCSRRNPEVISDSQAGTVSVRG
jgi:hypothetical protein